MSATVPKPDLSAPLSPRPQTVQSPLPLEWRTSTDKDYPFLYHSLAVSLKESLEATQAWTSEQIESHLQQMARRRWQFALRQGEPVGGMTTGHAGNKLYLHGLFVLPEHQNQGIGTAMLQELITRTRRRQLTLSLQVFFGNERARSLYLRMGFVIIGAVDTSYIMELPLTKTPPVAPQPVSSRPWEALLRRLRLLPRILRQ